MPGFTEAPRLEHVLAGALRARLADIHTGMPGRVTRYDSAKQCVDVQPLVKRGRTEEDGSRVAEELPIVTEVPVVFPGGSSFHLTFPVSVGDDVWLSFASCSLDRWGARGGLVDPEDDRRCTLTDAVAFLNLRDGAHPRASAPTDRARLGKTVALEVTETEVLVGGGSGHQSTFKTTDFLSAFNTLIGSIATAVGTSGTPAGATAAGTAITTALGVFATDVLPAITTVAKVR